MVWEKWCKWDIYSEVLKQVHMLLSWFIPLTKYILIW